MAVLRPFYIIGHNPNTVAEARAFLDAGANALEPDIEYDAGGADTYYVSERHPFPGSHPHDPPHSLAAYLDGLRDYLSSPANRPRLALIAFDIMNAPKNGENGGFEINAFLDYVAKRFTLTPEASGVAILVTVPYQERSGFLTAWRGDDARFGVGIDCEEDPKIAQQRLGKFAGKYSYGYGDSILWVPELYYWMSEAKGMHAASGGRDCRLVYPWVLKNEHKMRDYLDLRVDGAIFDLDDVAEIRGILRDPKYTGAYTLAVQGADPFADPLPPMYHLVVRTSQTADAGTDSPISIQLVGESGSLTTVVQGRYAGMLERSSVNQITVEGSDLGAIRSITLSSLASGPFSGWLPDKITVSGGSLSESVIFRFGKNDWVKVDQPLTRAPVETAPV